MTHPSDLVELRERVAISVGNGTIAISASLRTAEEIDAVIAALRACHESVIALTALSQLTGE